MDGSEALAKRALDVMPGGVSSPVRAYRSVGGTPRFFARAEGAHAWDVDGKRYVDFQMAFGPLLLGHADARVVGAVAEAASRGTAFGAPHEGEVLLAERIVAAHPAAKWVRFVNSGTEAVMSALRVARAATGRSLVVKFAGCYHGHADALLVKAGSGLATFGIGSSAGVPPGAVADTAVLPLDDDAALDAFFSEHGPRVACAIVEGVPANDGLLLQRREFMQRIEARCREHGALFLLDEVITGFRWGWGGAAERYGLSPDLVTFGKVIGGGLPVGAYGGRADLKSLVAPEGPVYQAGTLAGNPLATAAGLATLAALDAEAAPFEELEMRAQKLARALRDLFARHRVPAQVVQESSAFWILFADAPAPRRVDAIPPEAARRFAAFHRACLDEGVLFAPSAFEVAFLSFAHGPRVLAEALAAIDRAVARAKEDLAR